MFFQLHPDSTFLQCQVVNLSTYDEFFFQPLPTLALTPFHVTDSVKAKGFQKNQSTTHLRGEHVT